MQDLPGPSFLLRLVLACFMIGFVSCASSTHRFHDASFTLPGTWERTVAPSPKAFAATDATRDGYDLFIVVHHAHEADPASLPASQSKRMADSIADKALAKFSATPNVKEVRELSRGTGSVRGIPVMEQVVEAHMRWPDGQSGDTVFSSRLYAAKKVAYHFSLRESRESHRKDPGYFKRLMDTVRIE